MLRDNPQANRMKVNTPMLINRIFLLVDLLLNVVIVVKAAEWRNWFTAAGLYFDVKATLKVLYFLSTFTNPCLVAKYKLPLLSNVIVEI